LSAWFFPHRSQQDSNTIFSSLSFAHMKLNLCPNSEHQNLFIVNLSSCQSDPPWQAIIGAHSVRPVLKIEHLPDLIRCLVFSASFTAG
jgi:hypothetical protein